MLGMLWAVSKSSECSRDLEGHVTEEMLQSGNRQKCSDMPSSNWETLLLVVIHQTRQCHPSFMGTVFKKCENGAAEDRA